MIRAVALACLGWFLTGAWIAWSLELPGRLAWLASGWCLGYMLGCLAAGTAWPPGLPGGWHFVGTWVFWLLVLFTCLGCLVAGTAWPPGLASSWCLSCMLGCLVDGTAWTPGLPGGCHCV